MNGQVSDTGSPARAQSRLRLLLLDLARRWPGRAHGGRAPRGPGRPAGSTTRGQADRKESVQVRALVTLVPGRPTTWKPRSARSAASWSKPAIPKPHRSKLFSALVTSDDNLQPGKSSMVTVVVLGGDADDYLAPASTSRCCVDATLPAGR